MSGNDDHGTLKAPGPAPASPAPSGTVAGNQGQLTVTLRGAWNGDVTDPDREFHGEVAASPHAALPEGTPVRVVFQGTPKRVAEPNVHGTYTLMAGDQAWKLMRLSLPYSRAGGQVHDDTQATEWEAVLIDR
ncbi:hypothetical protein [Deinococcus ficus]|uniref:hypothetical protein n=1 Tax=Deinococcus ficus TaxID=317577 RepID=UPI00174E289B|nr:hypothetical protein [Deinococcus ficus]GHF76199.1 hypothetical protein GCM10017782_12580 [Deinococcus ficus]